MALCKLNNRNRNRDVLLLFQVSLRDVFETTNRVYVILELAEGGDLLEYINDNRHENEAQVKKHFQQLVSGLMAMHEMCIVHRDLKCENVLLDRNNNIKIAGIIYLFKQLYMSNIS